MTTQLFLKRFFLLTALVALTLPQGCGDDDPVDDPASNTNTEPQPTPEPEPEPERHAIEFAPSFSGATGHSQIGVFAFDTSTKWVNGRSRPHARHTGRKGWERRLELRSDRVLAVGRILRFLVHGLCSLCNGIQRTFGQRRISCRSSRSALRNAFGHRLSHRYLVLRLRFWISGIAKKRSGWSFDPSCRKSDSGSKDRVTRFRTSRCEVSSGRVKSH